MTAKASTGAEMTRRVVDLRGSARNWREDRNEDPALVVFGGQDFAARRTRAMSSLQVLRRGHLSETRDLGG